MLAHLKRGEGDLVHAELAVQVRQGGDDNVINACLKVYNSCL